MSEQIRTTPNPANGNNNSPTVEVYQEFNWAYGFFNTTLFNGELPPCLITVQRKGERVRGYFHGDRFGHRTQQGRTTDEIALNPMHFKSRTPKEVLSTLVHEMCHLWQHHKGKRPSGGYHNKQWAAKMKEVGLIPSDTGQKGGKETGKRLTHYIDPDGQFARAVDALLCTEEFKLHWYDRLDEMCGRPSGGVSITGGDEDDSSKKEKGGFRIKWECPVCKDAAWGKSTLVFGCTKCHVNLVAKL